MIPPSNQGGRHGHVSQVVGARAAQDDRLDSEGPARHSFDFGDLMSLGMGGGEYTFSHFAELLCLRGVDRSQDDAPPAEMRRQPVKRIFG